ncbi:RiPP maturation radical SAM C-methyltransferase [Sorangium sp. So ce367]|uniref:RiPP maturation radical SAM C-methyltransferase n=1 Tax=Sorangium sp. So ce367 TaxID=3133305 RepID=UPI003F5ECBE1
MTSLPLVREPHMPVAPSRDVADFRVALVCMPFASADRPSIQLGLIGAIARSAGFTADLYHFNLDLAAELTPPIYEQLCERRSYMTGEWLFARAAFGESAPGDEESYLKAFPGEVSWVETLGKGRAYFAELRRQILPAFIDRCLDAVDWGSYRIVGFSSLFQQNVASLALARRIKERHPQVHIIFGGANMEGEMGREYARAFPCIDYVVSGEADEVFPKLLLALARKETHLRFPGVIARTRLGLVDGGQAPPVHDLDQLPVPVYDTYFEHAVRLGLSPYYKSTWTLPYESSRGCWWGQKHHCTFCGLNGQGMAYRAKRPARVLEELSVLARKHRICSFMAVDNILDQKYVKDFFGEIERAKVDYCFFYEVKANLTREQIRALYRGGIRRVQPGIESMSSHILELMRKGCTMLQNVRCLKWCMYYGIGVNWNLIWGFPGEAVEDYERELEVLQCITHLEPPVGSGRIWLERFSPHFTDKSFPVSNMRPEASYGHVYPPHVDLMKAAYFFDYEMGDTVASAAHAATHAHVEQWRETWRSDAKHTLTYRRTTSGILIDVNRGPEHQKTYSVSGANAAIYELCTETIRTPAQVAEQLRALSAEHAYSADEVREAMDEFCRARLMLGEDDKYFSLALPSNPNW